MFASGNWRVVRSAEGLTTTRCWPWTQFHNRIKLQSKKWKGILYLISTDSFLTDLSTHSTFSQISPHQLQYYSQRPRSTRSSSVVTLARPASASSLKITDRSFSYALPCLWNQLPLSLRNTHSGTSSSISCSPIPSPIISSSFDSPLCSSLLHSRICFTNPPPPLSFISSSWTVSPDYCPYHFFWAIPFLFFVFSLFFFVFVHCARLNLPYRIIYYLIEAIGLLTVFPLFLLTNKLIWFIDWFTYWLICWL